MNIPKFTIKLDQELDQSVFIELFLDNEPLIAKQFPQIKNVKDVKAAIRYVYSHQDEHIGRGLKILNENVEKLKLIAETISCLMNYGWNGIEEITISPCSFPISPRFINENRFMVTYFFDDDIIRICAHEIVHFLYFKKLRDLQPGVIIETEYPSKEWLLSEIIAPMIVNDNEIQAILNNKDAVFIPDSIRLAPDVLNEIHYLYNGKLNFLEFREAALRLL